MKKYLLLVVFLVGCKDNYGACARVNQDIAVSITNSMKAVAQLNQQGQLTAQEAVGVLGYLEFANQGNEAFTTCISSAHVNGNQLGTYTACAKTFYATLSTPSQLALIHVSNPLAATQVNTSVTALSGAVTALETALGGS